MSTDQQHPTTSDFSNWLLLNTAKELPVVKYNPKTSLRAWFTNYRQLADSYHVPLQMCIRPSMLLLPSSIQIYASKLHPSILVDWDQYTNALLTRFGRPAHVEDGETMSRLKKLVQPPTVSVAEHTTNFELIVKDLHATKPDAELIPIYIRSLHSQSLRYVLLAIRLAGANNNSTTLASIMQNAQDMQQENDNFPVFQHMDHIMDDPQPTQQQATHTNSDTMDYQFDYVRGEYRNNRDRNASHQGRHKNQQRRHNPNASGSANLKMAWTDDGKPICDHCNKVGHKTTKCFKNRREKAKQGNHINSNMHAMVADNNIATVTPDSNDQGTSSSIHHVSATKLQSPHINLDVRGFKIKALIDTGAEISAINSDTCHRLKLPINTSNTITYQDINKNKASTMGMAQLVIFGKTVVFHVIKGLPKEMVIGWDLITALNGIINTSTQQLVFSDGNNKPFSVSISSQVNNIFGTSVVDDRHKQQIHKLIQQHSAIIPENNKKPSVTHLIEFTIDTDDHKPIYVPPRRLHPALQDKMDIEIKELLDLGIISPVDFPEWGSAAHMVSKADGSYRLVGDFKNLNKVTKRINYSFTAIHEALESIGQANIFTKLDLASGYWQIPVKEEDQHKTAITTRNGTYKFHVMPFGLCNAPAVF
ncbi:hypothetical protein [Absidia glauca]|uniref:Reverse transcriptase domain-containing protein n=1 Tax=Absidia glauca TaxID=4829 RepID=A0A168MNG5_ABSGL|nr:hypothetical protein [Absidia glauca]